MAIQNFNNKQLIIDFLKNDEYITKDLNINPDCIIKERNISEIIDENEIYIMVYSKGTIRSGNPSVRRSLYQIDILGHRNYPYGDVIEIIDQCMDHIMITFIEMYIQPNSLINFYDDLGVISTNPKQYQIGSQYSIDSIIHKNFNIQK